MFSAEYGRDLDVRTAMVKSRIEDRLVSAFGDVNGVCGVYMVPSGDAVHVCTIIDEDDEQTYEVIYEREPARSAEELFESVRAEEEHADEGATVEIEPHDGKQQPDGDPAAIPPAVAFQKVEQAGRENHRIAVPTRAEGSLWPTRCAACWPPARWPPACEPCMPTAALAKDSSPT